MTTPFWGPDFVQQKHQEPGIGGVALDEPSGGQVWSPSVTAQGGVGSAATLLARAVRYEQRDAVAALASRTPVHPHP